MVDEINEIEEDRYIKQSAEALRKLFESIEIEAEDYAVNILRTPERSQDRWGLISDVDIYRSTKSIDIIIDEFGNKKISVK